MASRRNDEPVLIDELGRNELVHDVARDVAKRPAPLVIGVHGDWGAGKTSFLHQLHWRLSGDCPQQTEEEREQAKQISVLPDASHVTVIWFEAWRYQHETAPVVALLQEIRMQLPLVPKLWTGGKKLGEVAAQSALRSLEHVTKHLGFHAKKAREEGERWEREHHATPLPSFTIRKELEYALKQILGKSKKGAPTPRLVVLVDDLDRCEPQAAYRLLEGIKVYLNLSNCVFVLGMDQRIIQSAIAKHLPEGAPELPAVLARDYLEKLCQDIRHLPMITAPEDVFVRWLGSYGDKDVFIKQAVRETRCLPANARKLKAFCNVLPRFLRSVPMGLTDGNLERETRVALLVACLYHFHQDVYRILEGHPRFYHDVLLPWAQGEPKRHPVLEGLKRTETPEEDRSERYATISVGGLVPAYPDPAVGNYLRVQRLIHSLGAVTESEIMRYTSAPKVDHV